MKFQQIRSALSVVEFAGVRFLIDPMLAPKNTYPVFPYTCVSGEGNPTTDLPVPLESLFDVDAVIVTHLHLDHFDDTAREKLPKSLVLFAQSEEEASQLRGWGFADVRVLLEEGVEFEGVRLYKTRCEHGEGNPVTSDAYDFMGFSGKACGVVFEATESARKPESFRFYLAGDTIFCEYVEEAIAKFSPAVVAVNAAGAQFPKGHPLIMNEYDVLTLMRRHPDIDVIATHLEGVSHATVTTASLRAFAKEKGLEKLAVPAQGETVEFAA